MFFLKVFSRIILRNAFFILIVGLILSAVGGYYSVELYKNLRTDLEELLPTTARSVVDLTEVTQRLESIDNLAILVFSQNVEASRRFVTDLAFQLKKAPKDIISSVEYRIDKELKFFKERSALYMDLSDLKEIRYYVENRINYEVELYNPLNIFNIHNASEINEPKFDFEKLKQKYSEKLSTYSRFPEGYYATPDGKKRAILVNMPGKSSGMNGIHLLKDYVVQTISNLKPSNYSSDIEIHYTGGVQNTIEEQAALIADLGISSVIVLFLVSTGMFLFFRALRATTALLLSLLMGTFWTFGLSYFVVGYLNANSAFLGSIIIGNGINFGIIYLARYLEERKKGRYHLRATYESILHTATATWTAALAAGLSYGSLMMTGFRGFNQFGVIGLIGMVLCWISAFTMLPALLTVFEKIKSLAPKKKKLSKAYLTSTLIFFMTRYPKSICFISILATLLSFGVAHRMGPNLIETDLSKLRNKESMEKGSGYLSKYVDEIFQRYLTPMVILPHSVEDSQKITELLREKKKKEGSNSLLASIQTLNDFIPKNQDEKIYALQEIKELLPGRIRRRIAQSDRSVVEEFLTAQVLKPVQVNELPGIVLEKFTEKNGAIGKMVVIEPPLSSEALDGNSLIRFIRELREVADSVAPGTPLAGSLPISSDMIESIYQDGPLATFFAFVSVVLLVIVLFRDFQIIFLILFSLFLGVIWMGGLILGFDLKINFLNFIALPITFGIGVDYGVNIFQRYREEGPGSILKVIRDTGGAVGLCSLSTMIGYSSLLIAENQAFVSFGRLCVLGELTCVFAAMVSLPAFLILKDRFTRRGKKNEEYLERELILVEDPQ